MTIHQTGARVVCLGHHQPGRTVTNDELSASLDTTDGWIRDRVGVRTRQIAGPDESVTDMACAAAAKALARSGIVAADIDMVVVATATSFDRMPSVAARVAAALGVTSAAVYDINAACAGFCYALAAADQAIRAGAASRAIVVGADKMSDFIDWTDRSTAVIFGDGAGAAVIEATGPGVPPGIGPVVWGSDPDRGRSITVETTGPDGPRSVFRQDGQAVFRWTTTTLAPSARLACERAGVEPADLGAVVAHQANLRIIRSIARTIGAHDAVVADDVIESGNTSAASIPLAMSKLIERHGLVSGTPILLFGFGAGLTYAGQVIRCP